MSANPAEPIRIVYFGTPTYAVPALEALLQDPLVEVSLVVTQPDRPAGRGRKLTAPPVKNVALAHGIEVHQPESLRTERDREPIAIQHPDLFVVAAFGKIFGPRLLSIPPLGSVNLHASLLPAYRGASPISAAILEGRDETGVTLMRMDTGLDTGPMLAQRSLPIGTEATTISLTPQLAQLGAELLIDSLAGLRDGTLAQVQQDEQCATLTRPLLKADGWIDWSQSAHQIERQVRAMWDWPRSWSTLGGAQVQIHRASVDDSPATGTPGSVTTKNGMPMVATGGGHLRIEVAQTAGGKPLPGALWLQQSGADEEVLGLMGAPEASLLPLIRSVGD